MNPVPPNTVTEPAMTHLLGIAQRPPARSILGLDQPCSKARLLLCYIDFVLTNT